MDAVWLAVALLFLGITSPTHEVIVREQHIRGGAVAPHVTADDPIVQLIHLPEGRLGWIDIFVFERTAREESLRVTLVDIRDLAVQNAEAVVRTLRNPRRLVNRRRFQVKQAGRRGHMRICCSRPRDVPGGQYALVIEAIAPLRDPRLSVWGNGPDPSALPRDLIWRKSGLTNQAIEFRVAYTPDGLDLLQLQTHRLSTLLDRIGFPQRVIALYALLALLNVATSVLLMGSLVLWALLQRHRPVAHQESRSTQPTPGGTERLLAGLQRMIVLLVLMLAVLPRLAFIWEPRLSEADEPNHVAVVWHLLQGRDWPRFWEETIPEPVFLWARGHPDWRNLDAKVDEQRKLRSGMAGRIYESGQPPAYYRLVQLLCHFWCTTPPQVLLVGRLLSVVFSVIAMVVIPMAILWRLRVGFLPVIVAGLLGGLHSHGVVRGADMGNDSLSWLFQSLTIGISIYALGTVLTPRLLPILVVAPIGLVISKVTGGVAAVSILLALLGSRVARWPRWRLVVTWVVACAVLLASVLALRLTYVGTAHLDDFNRALVPLSPLPPPSALRTMHLTRTALVWERFTRGFLQDPLRWMVVNNTWGQLWASPWAPRLWSVPYQATALWTLITLAGGSIGLILLARSLQRSLWQRVTLVGAGLGPILCIVPWSMIITASGWLYLTEGRYYVGLMPWVLGGLAFAITRLRPSWLVGVTSGAVVLWSMTDVWTRVAFFLISR
ncbi:MAG: hypothetical protein CL878_05760 [Dehalococcoidia bacterium]|nr:hypothetical protein [Dehalococcoidia bacterium]